MRATTSLHVIVHPACDWHGIVKSACGSYSVLVLKNPGQLGTAQAADRASAAFADIVPPRVKHTISTTNAILFICFSYSPP